MQYGLITLARPPVAITFGTCERGHSPLMRRTMPSTESTAPKTTPARMHSSVRVPITFMGAMSSVAGSLEVRRKSVSAEVRTPG